MLVTLIPLFDENLNIGAYSLFVQKENVFLNPSLLGTGRFDGSHVYPPEELMDKALELAQAIAANAQVAVRESKAAIRRGLQTDMATGAAFEAEAFALCDQTL